MRAAPRRIGPASAGVEATPRRNGLAAAAALAIVLASAGAAAAADGVMAPPLPAGGGGHPGPVEDGAPVLPSAGAPAERTAEAAERAAGPDAPGRGSAGPAEAAPGPASRLLRALAARPDPGRAAPGDEAAVYAAEGCPRGLLRRLLAGAADDPGALTALGIEREVLTLCRERQEVVAGLFEAEARLRELRARGEEPVPAAPAAAVKPAPAPAARGVRTASRARPAPPGAAPAGAAAEPGTPPVPRYGWFSIIGTAGALRAGVTDGTGVWFVREGDALPGGGTVAAVVGRPPAVRVERPDGTGGGTPLPWRAPPGAGP